MHSLAHTTAAALQAELDRSLAADASLHGISATVHAPRIGLAWSGASGSVHRQGGGTLTPAHAFRIASVTKPYTACVALRLAEQRRLDLFAPIAPLLDAATRHMLVAGGYEPDRITAFHLLTHGSGLRDHAGRDTSYGAAVLRDPMHIWTHAEQIEFCMSLGGPLSPPGTHFCYSDTGYLILGDLLERAAGQPLQVLMRKLLHFDRLGLTQTHFERLESAPDGQQRAGQYIDDIDAATIDCSCGLSGGGGLIATTAEMACFFRAAALGDLFDQPQTLSLALATPSLLFKPPHDMLHAPLMRGRRIGDEQGWFHSGFWGVVAAYCPASDVAMALTWNQAKASESTFGLAGDSATPGLADRLSRVAQAACRP